MYYEEWFISHIPCIPMNMIYNHSVDKFIQDFCHIFAFGDKSMARQFGKKIYAIKIKCCIDQTPYSCWLNTAVFCLQKAADGLPGSDLHDANPFLGGEVCLLCRCERPASPIRALDDEEEECGRSSSLSQLPLWVCRDCRKTVEEEEKRAAESSALVGTKLAA